LDIKRELDGTKAGVVARRVDDGATEQKKTNICSSMKNDKKNINTLWLFMGSPS
jgi:hypothetical protein